MKTGNDVFNRALLLLGYTGIDGAVNGAQSAELFRREQIGRASCRERV